MWVHLEQLVHQLPRDALPHILPVTICHLARSSQNGSQRSKRCIVRFVHAPELVQIIIREPLHDGQCLLEQPQPPWHVGISLGVQVHRAAAGGSTVIHTQKRGLQHHIRQSLLVPSNRRVDSRRHLPDELLVLTAQGAALPATSPTCTSTTSPSGAGRCQRIHPQHTQDLPACPDQWYGIVGSQHEPPCCLIRPEEVHSFPCGHIRHQHLCSSLSSRSACASQRP
mmetsp:Transcript_2754/g.6046  ORF Transcript_2754/g.6046 Transcript_2754/m.6046 type:complete len:225 (-) Transcript_2754:154-828(-)